jgi:hypothetical protein
VTLTARWVTLRTRWVTLGDDQSDASGYGLGDEIARVDTWRCVGSGTLGRFAFEAASVNPLFGPRPETLLQLGAKSTWRIVDRLEVRVIPCAYMDRRATASLTVECLPEPQSGGAPPRVVTGRTSLGTGVATPGRCVSSWWAAASVGQRRCHPRVRKVRPVAMRKVANRNVSGGRSLTRPFRDALRFPSTWL